MSTTQSETICEQLRERLKLAGGQYSYRELGRLTGVHPETIRRYMQGHAPSAVFLSRLCDALGVSGEWLLTGRGPMSCKEISKAALRRANVQDLLQAMSSIISDQEDRLEQLSRAVQELHKPNAGSQCTGTHSQQSRPKARKLSRLSEPKAEAGDSQAGTPTDAGAMGGASSAA
ncbi:MAG: helix-turn-helix domain-containing protein [Phycisphaerales bacterium]